MTKGRHYRDDPAFLVLFGWLVAWTAMGYIVAVGGGGSVAAGIATASVADADIQASYSAKLLFLSVLLSVWRYIRFCLWLLCVDYLAFGIIMATVGFIIGNNYLMEGGAARGSEALGMMGRNFSTPTLNRKANVHPYFSSNGTPSNVDDDNESTMSSFTNFDEDSLLDDESFMSVRNSFQFHQHAPSLEWLYCFDVHLNAFFGLFCIIYITQYLMLPLLLKDNFITIALGNSLYAIGFAYYFLVTFYGYLELKFLSRVEVLLSPIAFVFVVWVLSIIFQVHIVSFVLSRWIG